MQLSHHYQQIKQELSSQLQHLEQQSILKDTQLITDKGRLKRTVKLDEENYKLRTSLKGNCYFSIIIYVMDVSGRESE